VKKNRCCHCQTLFTPAFRHPNQSCCGKRKCILAGRAKLQKKKMDEDPDYRENQKLSNKKWIEKHPNYWKEYRKANPDTTLKNRLMQQIRNQKRVKTNPAVAKVNLDELIAKMYLVKSEQPRQQISFWLLSMTARIAPIKVVLIGTSDRSVHLSEGGLNTNPPDNLKSKQIKERITDVQGGFA
jgi:hypothetical protein